MAYFQRIALLLFFCIPAFLPNSAFADYPSTPIWKTDTGTVFYGATAAEALDKYVARFSTCTTNTQYINSVIEKLATTYRVNWLLCSNNSQVSTGYIDASKLDDCGDGRYESPYNGTCVGTPPPVTCTPPQVRDAATNTCVNVPCVDGQTVAEGPWATNNNPTVICISATMCEALKVQDQPPEIDCAFSASGNGTCVYYHYYHYVTTGVSCGTAVEPTGAATPTPSTCAQCECMESGGSWGEVGDVNTCVPQGSAGSAPVTVTPPPKTTTTTPPATPENPNPTPVTTTEQPPIIVITPAAAGSASGDPTITETTTNPDGSTTTKTQTKGQYCAEKPTAEVCNGDGTGSKNSYGGVCNPDGSVQITCDGDAIQCAIAKESAELNCLHKPTPELLDAFNAAKNPLSDNPALMANRTVVNVPDALDDSTPFGASCPDDMFFTIAGHQITLPISTWCPYLAWVGNVFLALAYLYGARSLVGSL